MPMFTTFRIRLPVWPVNAPLRILEAKSAIASSTLWTSATTSAPSTSIRLPRGARSATCRTARRSVELIFSPANIASRRFATPRSSASCSNSRSVSSVIRFFE